MISIFRGDKRFKQTNFASKQRALSRFRCSALLIFAIVFSLLFLNFDVSTVHADLEDGLPLTGLTYENYPPLKEQYEDYFSFGIFGRGEIEGLIYNYDSYTPGNEMKPESTQNRKGTFTYEAADSRMQLYADENPDLKFYGHTLTWHSQSPTWMWDAPPGEHDQPGEYDYDTALENMNTHIENVLGYYGADLVAIDVVNEAIGDPDPNDWRASLAKGEGWYNALGSDWVELAFLKAAEVVDENGWDVKLIYNDFGLDWPDKARVTYEMVKDINERYADARPNGLPLIEVIGMQAHYGLNTNVQDVEDNIKLFATLPGVSVHITEMDVGLPPGNLLPVNENNQGMKYAELFQIYRNYAVGPANTTDNPKVIETVKLAGVIDVAEGWRGGEFAMPYDYDGLAKKALLGILYPEEFLATHDYMEPERVEDPVDMDGVFVYDASLGDVWSGANIILGNDASEWPWSTGAGDGKVAFTPEQDATYRLSVNYTSLGTSAIRVRWLHDDSNGGYTSADEEVVNSYEYSASQVATHIPAYFNSGMVNMGSYTLTTEIQLDGSESADGLIGNIAIRGGGGGSAYSINTIEIEKIGEEGDPDTMLVSWPDGVDNNLAEEVDGDLDDEDVSDEEPEDELEETIETADEEETSTFNWWLFAVIVVLLGGLSVIFVVRRKRDDQK